jgi:hypothetical protein
MTKRPNKSLCFVPYICNNKKTIQKTELCIVFLSHTFVTTKRPYKGTHNRTKDSALSHTFVTTKIPYRIPSFLSCFWLINLLRQKDRKKTMLSPRNLIRQKNRSFCLVHFVSQSPMVIKVNTSFLAFLLPFGQHPCLTAVQQDRVDQGLVDDEFWT